MNISITHDLEYLILFSLVQILPKILLRIRIPSGITALFIGVIAGFFDPRLDGDTLFKFLSQIGITSLFLFAGLEVNFSDLKKDRVYLLKYLTGSVLFILIITYGLKLYFNLPFQESLIYALGIFTPSAGFIINSLNSFEISEDQEYWIKSKAISKEIVAILLLFLALQSDSLLNLGKSIILFSILFLALPFLFRFFFKFISPYAPNSEIPFLVVLSLIAGVLSKEFGAYYLVGAFAVGLVGSNFKSEIFKEDQEVFFKSLSSFFMVFLPFYFFYAGLKIVVTELNLKALLVAITLFLIFVPLRIQLIRISMGGLVKKVRKSNLIISLSLMPTLIFGLVISTILMERKIIPLYLVYALIIYTLFTSLLPTFMLNFKNEENE